MGSGGRRQPLPRPYSGGMDDYGKNSTNNIRLACGHQFHKQCLATWVSSQKLESRNGFAEMFLFSSSGSALATCPCCRKTMSWGNYREEDLSRVLFFALMQLL